MINTQRIAAIDIGSNSLKLAIVEAAASDSFTVIQQDRERLRLGQQTLKTRRLSDEAITASCEAISRFRSIADTRNVDALIAVATASVRQAKNADEFVRKVEEATGITVEVLPSLEEARIIGLASTSFFNKHDSSLLNIDIGGGSTELSLMRDGKPDKLFSMKLGAVGLTERYCKHDPPKKKEINRIREEIDFALSQPRRKIRGSNWEIATGTSGTILNTAALLNFVSANELETVPPIQLESLKKLTDRLSGLSLEERANIPVISHRRAEVIISGTLILEGVMTALGIDEVRTCPYALREGVVIDYMQQLESESIPPVPDLEDQKLKSVVAVGRRYGYEETHATAVARMSESLFDLVSSEFGLDRSKRTLLSAAALLHDVGYHISHEAHHKHSLYLIKNSSMTGFTESEKSMIANIARYHRKALPKPHHKDYTELSDKDRRTVDEMSAILRLADGLDRGYEGRVERIEVEKEGSEVMLSLYSDQDVSQEMNAINAKKMGFEQTFSCKLKVQSKPAQKTITV